MVFLEGSEGERAKKHLAEQQFGERRRREFDGETMYGPDEGYVYFITIGEPAIWVKIGYTAGDPYARMANLQTGCPYPMTMAGFVLATIGLEQDLHSVLAEYRKQGEWFELSERVAYIIACELNAECVA